MLSKINTVGSWFKSDSDNKELEDGRYNNEWLNGFTFDSIKFNDEAKEAFSRLPIDIEMFDQHALVTINSSQKKTTNQCYIPSQYFLYAVRLQPLVVLLNNYMEVFERVKNSVSGASEFENLINTQQPPNQVLNALDSYSKENFISAFKDSSNRMGGKKLLMIKAQGRYIAQRVTSCHQYGCKLSPFQMLVLSCLVTYCMRLLRIQLHTKSLQKTTLPQSHIYLRLQVEMN
ncbi:hypothetical protein JCM19052_5393 [Vibrio sp. JCM 19052]|nr:hypothetical protein JCM19052_5393 [Vibrio sp. JCM 19052]